MYLDERSNSILKLIVNNSEITGKDIEKKLNLSRKQVSYSLLKVNDYLHENNYSKIKRTKTGNFIIGSDVILNFASNDKKEISKNYYSYLERADIINLMLLTSCDILSTYDFTDILKVSKNTILSDLKKNQKFLDQKYHLLINYNRKKGYAIVGDEYEKRELLIYVIKSFLNRINGEDELVSIAKIDIDEISRIKLAIYKIEKELQIRFSYKIIIELAYIIYFLKIVSNKQKLITIPVQYQYMLGTKEYAVVKNSMAKKLQLAENEIMILTSIIQTTYIEKISPFNDDSGLTKDLMEVADKIIYNFEKNSMISFIDKESLKEMLIQHCKPAFYRIKYNFHIDENVIDMVIPSHQNLFEIVKKSITPFSELVKCEVNDNELAYITILFGGFLKREGSSDKLTIKKKAIVVCTNGISISTYMYSVFKELFPEFEFIGWYSKRSFDELKDDYDIVFSTDELKTKKKLFIYRPFINEQAKMQFRDEVLDNLNIAHQPMFYISEIVKIVKKYAFVNNEKQLSKELENYLMNDKKPASKKPGENLRLLKVLEPENIIVQNAIIRWEDAIIKTAAPLVKQNSIEKRYVDSMIRDIKNKHPFINIAKNVIIAHSSINAGVNEVSVAIMKLNYLLDIEGYTKADIIVVLASPTYTTHLGVLNDIVMLTESEIAMEEIRESQSSKEIFEIIKEREGD